MHGLRIAEENGDAAATFPEKKRENLAVWGIDLGCQYA